MDITRTSWLVAIAALLTLSGCGGGDGSNGQNGSNGLSTLTKVTAEVAGTNCTAGGSKIEAGPDSNANGVLDTTEVTTTSYICNGASGQDGSNGLATLIKVTAEAFGPNCPAGGSKIESGLDGNTNGVLDAAEVSATSYVCNGSNGQDGSNALPTLTQMTIEPPGVNCPNGGTRVDAWLDDGDGVLDPTFEPFASSYVCNGVNGQDGSNGISTLTKLTTEPAGANCPSGGTRVDAGPDSNANGLLDAAEVSTTSYVCSWSVTWIDVTNSAIQAESNKGYVANSASQVMITLPVSPAVGDIVQVTGVGAGGWKIAQNSGQTINATNVYGIGGKWEKMGTNFNPTLEFMASSSDGSRLIAAGTTGFVSISSDRGRNWTACMTDMSRTWSAVASSADGSKLIAVVKNGSIYTSADYGTNWTEQMSDAPRAWSGVASSADGNKLVAVVTDGSIYTSVDAGVSWTEQMSDTPRAWTAVTSSADGNHLFALVTSGDSYVSSDAGASWTVLPGIIGNTAASSSDGRTLLLAGGGRYCNQTGGNLLTGYTYTCYDTGYAWVSRDYGATWISVVSNANYIVKNVASSADGRILAAGGLVSIDAGTSWYYGGSPNAMSADGGKLFQIALNSFYVSDPWTTLGVAGSLSGLQYDDVSLQYTGNGVWKVVSSSSKGKLVIQ